MKSVIIIAVLVVILILMPPCCGLRNKRSPIATTTLRTTQLYNHQTSPYSTLTSNMSRVPTTDASHFTTKDLFPQNSQIVDAIIQKLGEEILNQYTSPFVRCAMDRVIKGYRSVFENGCNTEELQKIREQIENHCDDEAWYYSLTLERAKKTGIQVCMDWMVKADLCSEIDVSDQLFCDDFYVLTLNCSMTQNSTETTSSIPASFNRGTTENNEVSVAGLAGVALGCFIFGILITLLVMLILYKHRQLIRKRDQASISSTNFPNLRRPLPIPRNKSDIYDKIEEANEIQQAKLMSVLSAQEDNYDHLNARKSVKESVQVRYTTSVKRESTPNGFYTFDPRKSVDGSATQEITKYGKLSPRDAIDSQGTDSMGYLSSSKLSQIRAMEGTIKDSNDNLTGIAKIDEERGSICSEKENVRANGDLRDDMEEPDYRDSEEWFTREVGNKEKQIDNEDEMQKDTTTKTKEASDDMEEPTYRRSGDWFQDEMKSEEEETKMSDNESTSRDSNERVTEEVENGNAEKKESPDMETQDMEAGDYYILETTESRA
ncbi:uncharacterized protein LOC133194745 isoform X2 [Saccostrea echinata]|uniref:uncharacterized protein LOC133194745 isoform X2 n=1 Tax=Saccostrea echinata TaxID=191078 RepID=UPI002A7F1C56|nr:uncharacterized protein LOC133194745 isoform X2 [Saccostrea echinata]